MSRSNPARLCRYNLPSGRTCNQIALKDEQVCRHHMRLFRLDETEMLHQEAMERLAARLHSLDLPDLLHALYGKLTRLRSTVRANPEAQLALTIVLDRLKQQGHNQRPAPSQNLRALPGEDAAVSQGTASALSKMGFSSWPDPDEFEPSSDDSPEPSVESVNQQIAELLKILHNH